MLDGADIERAIAAAKAELGRREQSRKRLLEFTRFVKSDYRVGAPHRLIASKLDRVLRGEIRRLMILAPRRHGKSELGTRKFPPFFLGHYPGKQIITASANAGLARDFGKNVRDMIKDNPAYRVLFPNTAIDEDTRAQGRWDTTAGGIYVSSSIGASIIGRGADCLIGSTMLQTPGGPRSIADIAISDKPVYALAYDEAKHRPVFAPVVAGARRSANIVYRITCSSGEVVTATGNHRFRRGDCWVEAQALSVGDILLRVVQGGREHPPARGAEESEGGALDVLLQSGMREPQCEQETVGGRATNLQEMREGSAAQIEPLLLGEMSGSGTAEETVRACEQNTRATVRGLLQDLPPNGDNREVAILLGGVPGGMAIRPHDPRTEPGLAGGDSAGPVCKYAASTLQARSSAYHSDGWWVRRLPQQGEAGDTSYRHGCHKQLPNESRDAVQKMPCSVPCGGAFEIEEVSVALVEQVREESWVYDVQIGKHRNFFANGVLVHNCLLIDDAFSSRAEAESAAAREAVWSWYTSVARPALMPGGVVVVINTRWHQDDLCGRLLKAEEEGTGEKWEVVSIEALCEHPESDPLNRKLGEAAWPQAYPVPDLLAIKNLDEGEFEAQYQQNPVPKEGLLFQADRVSVLPDRPKDVVRWVRAWDIAATEAAARRDPDWTVGVLVGRTPGGRYVIGDVVRLRGSPDAVQAAISQTAAIDGHGVSIRLPQDPGAAGKSYAAVLIRMLAGYDVKAAPVTGSKATRAAPLAAQVNSGNVSIVAGPWNAPFVNELRSFPAGRHDDQVDAASDAFSAVAIAGIGARRTHLNIMGR